MSGEGSTGASGGCFRCAKLGAELMEAEPRELAPAARRRLEVITHAAITATALASEAVSDKFLVGLVVTQVGLAVAGSWRGRRHALAQDCAGEALRSPGLTKPRGLGATGSQAIGAGARVPRGVAAARASAIASAERAARAEGRLEQLLEENAALRQELAQSRRRPALRRRRPLPAPQDGYPEPPPGFQYAEFTPPQAKSPTTEDITAGLRPLRPFAATPRGVVAEGARRSVVGSIAVAAARGSHRPPSSRRRSCRLPPEHLDSDGEGGYLEAHAPPSSWG